MISNIFNIDCMDGMKEFPDKYFDLAVVDPPYGINITKNKRLNNNSANDWDSTIPTPEYFEQLFRVSKNQIIWGGNYFIEHLNNTRCFINWDKLNHSDTYADCEMAWTSFDRNAKIFKYMWDGNRYGYEGNIKGVGKPTIRIHPTQKPIALYSWIYKNYLPQGGKVIDTHLGSGSNRIAADKAGNIDFWGYELDKDYYEAQERRWKDYKSQLIIEF